MPSGGHGTWDSRGRATLEDFERRCPDNIKLIGDIFRNSLSQVYVKAQCLVCDNTWTSKAGRVVNFGCPKCSQATVDRGTKTHVQFARELKQRSPDIKALEKYTSSFTHIQAKHTCGHIWSVTPANLMKGRGCPKCKNRMRLSAIKGEYVRGYEPQAIEWIVKNKLAKAKDLQVTGIPYIKYKYSGKWHRYHPDMLIASQNRIVEVKSIGTLGIKHRGTWFKGNASQLFAKTKAKRRGCIEQGFKFVLMLMEENGSRIKLPLKWYDMTLNQLRASMISP